MADLTEHRDAAAKALHRFMRPADAIGYADLMICAVGPRLHTLHTAEDLLGRLTVALGRVLADLEAGDEMYASDLLAELRQAGDDVYGAVITAAEEAAQLTLAEVEAVAL